MKGFVLNLLLLIAILSCALQSEPTSTQADALYVYAPVRSRGERGFSGKGDHTSSTLSPADWLEGWNYRKAIRITSNSGSALTDYQVGIDITTSIYDNTGLVGSWHFNEGSGTIVADASGNGNDGTMMNMDPATDWVDGRFGKALDFDGANDYVVVPNSNSLNITGNAVTVAAWIKHSSAGWHPVCDGIVQHEGQYALQINNGQPTFYVNTGSGWVYARWANTLALSTWYYVVGTYDGSGIRIWVNGIERASTNNSGNLSSTSNTICLGSSANGTYPFNGIIDEVRIYNRALSSDEISALYNASKARLDYADLRFTSSDGTTTIPYWLESDKKVWVKVPSISTTGTTIYMYYGNSSATNMSNGDSTFTVFENFSTDVFSASPSYGIWTRSNSTRVYVSDGWLVEPNVGTNDDWADVDLTSSLPLSSTIGIRILTRFWSNGASGYNYYSGRIAHYNSLLTTFSSVSWLPDGSNGWYLGGGWVNKDLSVPSGYNYYTKLDYAVFSDSTSLSRGFNDTSPIFIATNNNSSTVTDLKKIRLIQSWDINWKLDYLILGKCARPEPSISIYAEQKNNLFLSYRKSITIDNTGESSTLYDYQVKIENPVYDETGLVGSWHFNEGGGNIAYDRSGKNYNGVFVDRPQWVSGRFGTCLSFDGVNDCVQIPNIPEMSGNSTRMCWLYTSSVPTSQVWLVGQNMRAQLIILSTGHVAINAFLSDNNFHYVADPNPVPTNEWVHYAGIISTSGGYTTLALYKNGVQVASGSFALTVASNNGCSFWIGGVQEGGSCAYVGQFFNGKIDEVRFYNRALSNSEILAHYQAHARPDYVDLRFSPQNYWIDSNWDISYPYWIEKDGIFWVKVDEILASSNKTIYAHYGNTTASSVLNGDETFEFCDDFNYGFFNFDKWEYTGTLNVSSGSCQIDALEGIRAKKVLGTNIPIVLDFNKKITGGYTFSSFMKEPGSGSFGVSSTNKIFSMVDDNSKWRWNKSDGQHEDSGVSYDGSWHTYRLIWSPTASGYDLYRSSSPRWSELLSNLRYAYYSGGWQITSVVPSLQGGFKVEFCSGSSSDATSYLDYVLARKYASTEPTIGTPGSEETIVAPSVTTLSANPLGGSSARLNGNLSNLGGDSSCEVWFQYGLTTSYTDSTPHQLLTSPGNFSARITGLTNATLYHFRAMARNSAGVSQGSDMTFTTLTPTPITVDWNNGNVQQINLQGDAEFIFTNGRPGAIYNLILIQDENGFHNVDFPATIKWAGGTPPVISTSPNSVDICTFLCNGTYYYGTFNADFR